jgi:hypothetical protein
MTPASQSLAQRTIWGGVLTAVTVVSTLGLACATPFAALAALAALFLPRRDAFVLIAVNWIANQAIGFGLLHYPLNWDCYLGGINLGLAALACTAAAMAGYRASRRAGFTASVLGSFAAAFVTYEGVLYAASPWRAGGDFNLPITLYILYINGLAFVGLLILQRLGLAFGIAWNRSTTRNSPAPFSAS